MKHFSIFTHLYFKLLTVLFLLVTFYLLLTCSDPVKPKPPNGPDTTSHDFSWTIDTLGDYGSYLKDVVIINKNDILAVGEIHKTNVNAPDSVFSFAKWNGEKWNFEQIFKSDGSKLSKIRGIWYVNQNDMWYASGSIYHWNGQVAEMSLQRDIHSDEIYTKIWYNSASDIYAIGNAGYITHYNGSSWQRLESGTDIDLLDVWGGPAGSVVWACGYTDFIGTVLLKITGTTVENVYEDNEHWFTFRSDTLSGVLTSIWSNCSDTLFLCSPYGMYKASSNSNGKAQWNWFNNDPVPGFPRKLRGLAKNDILMVGDFHMIAHYNGLNWRYFKELRGRVRWLSLDYKSNIAALVGYDVETSKAVISIGKN